MVVKVVGLTGCICAGKSTITRFVSQHTVFSTADSSTVEVVVLDADKVGWEVYRQGTNCYQKLVDYFTDAILNSETKDIDRKILGGIVFSDNVKMLALQSIVWPEMRLSMSSTIKDIRRRASESGANVLVLLEAAVMVEASWSDLCDIVWVVLLPRAESVSRLMKRNGLSVEDAIIRVNAQISDEERTKAASRVIDGSLPEEAVEAETSRLLKEDFLDCIN